MRRIDSFISFAMWSIIAMAVPVMPLLATDRSLRSAWQYTVALCLLLPPALSIGQLDGGPGPYSPWFYRSRSSRCCGSPALVLMASPYSPTDNPLPVCVATARSLLTSGASGHIA